MLSFVFFINKTFACVISGRKKYVEMKYVKWIRNHYNLAYFECENCQVEDKIILNDRGNLKIDKYCILLPTVYSEGEEEYKKIIH